MKKIKVRPISEIKDCPFYTLTVENRPTCLFKHLMPKATLMSASESPVDFTDEEWRQNCGGKFKKCTIIPLFYEEEEGEDFNFIDQEIEDYNPFEAQDKPLANVILEMEQTSEPYTYDTDVIVFPANLDLAIDDRHLDTITKGKVQRECDHIPRPIEMGTVYKTSSGGAGTGVKAKCIYHAVVSGLSRLVANEIKPAMLQALQRADAEKYSTIAFLPFDCGTLGIDEAAVAQLAATKEFMAYGTIKHLKKIVFLLPEQESYDSFRSYHDRVFENVQ